jgi:hypothetical protein
VVLHVRARVRVRRPHKYANVHGEEDCEYVGGSTCMRLRCAHVNQPEGRHYEQEAN